MKKENDKKRVRNKVKKEIDDKVAFRQKFDTRVQVYALNYYGDGQHPVATDNTLGFYTKQYINECLTKCAASSRVEPGIRQRARELIKP